MDTSKGQSEELMNTPEITGLYYYHEESGLSGSWSYLVCAAQLHV